MPDTRHDPGIPTLTVRAGTPNDPPVLTQVVDDPSAAGGAPPLSAQQALRREIDAAVRRATDEASEHLRLQLEREIPAIVARVLAEHGTPPDSD